MPKKQLEKTDSSRTDDVDIREDSEPKSSVFNLIEKYAPIDESYFITLAKGDRLQYKNVQDRKEIRQLHASAQVWTEQVRANEKQTIFARFASLDDRTLIQLHILAQLDLNDYFGKTLTQKLESYADIAKRAGFLFNEIQTKVDLRSLNYDWEEYREKVLKTKED